MFTAAVAAPSCCAYLYTTNTQNNLGESQAGGGAEAENELTCPANSATVTLLPSFLPTLTHY